MASTWPARKADLKTNLAKRSLLDIAELSIPTHFRCPVSFELMKDPVTVSTGITYDRQSIETWLDMGNMTCPVTNQELNVEDLIIPNHSIRRMIQDWCVANHSYGIERIPTPKIPATPAQVSEILSGIATASQRGETTRCRELVAKVKAFAKESERNRRCFAANGAGRALAASFSAFAGGPSENSTTGVLEDILSALVFMLPLDEEGAWHIGSPESLNSMVSILKCGDLARRLCAVMVVKELVSGNREWVEVMAKAEGLIEELVKLIKEPIFPQATKASLVATFYMVNSDERVASRFVDLGLVPVLLEILVDPEKSMCEKALAVLNGLLSCEEGREKAYEHALTMPVLVKKMFRVSDMATEFVVSALWKLCKNYKEEEEEEGERSGGCLVEALQVGAFQKILLLLQVGCGSPTKEKATDLLKLLNGYRGRAECIDTMDFKGLKRPF